MRTGFAEYTFISSTLALFHRFFSLCTPLYFGVYLWCCFGWSVSIWKCKSKEWELWLMTSGLHGVSEGHIQLLEPVLISYIRVGDNNRFSIFNSKDKYITLVSRLHEKLSRCYYWKYQLEWEIGTMMKPSCFRTLKSLHCSEVVLKVSESIDIDEEIWLL